MIKRDEVVALAESANDPTISSMRLMLVNPETVHELARTWLAVDRAPVGEISEAGFNEDLRGFVQLMVSDATVADVPIGQRVKLVPVPEADSGGEG